MTDMVASMQEVHHMACAVFCGDDCVYQNPMWRACNGLRGVATSYPLQLDGRVYTLCVLWPIAQIEGTPFLHASDWQAVHAQVMHGGWQAMPIDKLCTDIGRLFGLECISRLPATCGVEVNRDGVFLVAGIVLPGMYAGAKPLLQVQQEGGAFCLTFTGCRTVTNPFLRQLIAAVAGAGNFTVHFLDKGMELHLPLTSKERCLFYAGSSPENSLAYFLGLCLRET